MPELLILVTIIVGAGALWVILPVLAVADVFLFRSGRGSTFWIRACGFEVVTVFATAAIARVLINSLSAAALGRLVK